MKRLFFFSLLMTSMNIVNAQYEIIGKITDHQDTPLLGATVVLLDGIDSTMVSFGLTDDMGRYRLEDVDSSNYIIQVSYVSYSNYSEILDVDWSRQKIELEPIILQESTEILQEVTIKAEHIPMGIKGDTISYNASAFKTRPNATVEDLLKKLPGIEVERNGNIKAQGEDVENVLVDGKEFFGGDPKMATKNLEAEAVDKVEVYDKKSEIAEFTGIDDGQEEKTINLKLKEDHKNGGFGTVSVDGGTEDRYKSKLNYFRFSPALQASLVMASNNVNKETFTVNDQIDFMGGIANAMASGTLNLSNYQGLGDGLNTSTSTGINLNYDFSPKLMLRSNYIYNAIDNDLDQQSLSNNFTDEISYNNLDTLASDTEERKHQINTRLIYKLNPLFEVIFKNNYHWNDRNRDRNEVQYYYTNNVFEGLANSNLTSTQDKGNFDSNTLIKKKFKKPGRNWINSITYKYEDDNISDGIINNNMIGGNMFSIDQEQQYRNEVNQFDISSKYTEPLSKIYFLGFNYQYGRSKENPYRAYYDIISNSRILNTDLTANYEKLYEFQVAGLDLRRNTKKLKMNAGIKYQKTTLEGNINNGAERIYNDFENLLPSFSIDYDMRGGKSMRMDYFTSIQSPRLEELLPLPDNTFGNLNYIGSPNLVPEYNHKMGLSYHYFDNFSFTNFWLNLDFNYSKNRIVEKRNIDDNLFQTIQPVNSDNYWDVSTYFNFGRPFRPLKIDYKLRTRMRYANYDSFINDVESGVAENTANVKLSINNRKTDKVYLETGLSLDINMRKYDLNSEFDQTFFNTDYYIDFEWYLPKGWTVTSDFNFRKYSDESFADSPSYKLWHATLSKLLWNDKLEVRLSAYDILNENIGFRRYGTINSLRQYSFNNLGQYFSLGVSYKIGKGKSKGGIRVEIDE